MTNLHWEPDSRITVRTDNGEAVISANKPGLLSLANHLTTLASGVPGGHIHLDEHNSLEEGSTELIIEKTN